ncbi:hypothetical protein MFLAVUS_009281 [Mucor flavus]|uniref:Uncharacterized protein n=1 Tax=Mucor flavus TaxID=439312 RepID=A0ABP9Z9J0_9FUNG
MSEKHPHRLYLQVYKLIKIQKYIKDKQLIKPNNKIGGRNEIVEIDETKIAKRKYNKGHKVEGAWVIGGIQRKPIEERNIENINEIINKYIKKVKFNDGNTIQVNNIKKYDQLNNNYDDNYEETMHIYEDNTLGSDLENMEDELYEENSSVYSGNDNSSIASNTIYKIKN